MVILLLFYYITAYDPYLDPFRAEGDTKTQSRHVNVYDRVILSAVRSLKFLDFTQKYKDAKGQALETALNRVRLGSLPHH